MQERSRGESNLDKKLMWGGAFGALVSAGFGVGVLVRLSLLVAGSGVAINIAKRRFVKKENSVR